MAHQSDAQCRPPLHFSLSSRLSAVRAPVPEPITTYWWPFVCQFCQINSSLANSSGLASALPELCQCTANVPANSLSNRVALIYEKQLLIKGRGEGTVKNSEGQGRAEALLRFELIGLLMANSVLVLLLALLDLLVVLNAYWMHGCAQQSNPGWRRWGIIEDVMALIVIDLYIWLFGGQYPLF